jgi:hypothetical protein
MDDKIVLHVRRQRDWRPNNTYVKNSSDVAVTAASTICSSHCEPVGRCEYGPARSGRRKYKATVVTAAVASWMKWR